MIHDTLVTVFSVSTFMSVCLKDFTWKHLIEELSRGVVLRPSKDQVRCRAPVVVVDTSPFNQLLQDIRFRRYKLRKVPVSLNSSPSEHRTRDPLSFLVRISVLLFTYSTKCHSAALTLGGSLSNEALGSIRVKAFVQQQ